MSEETFLLVGTIVSGFLVGAMFGAAPLICGIVRKKLWLGILSQLLCIACGLCMPLAFSQPISWTILLAILLSALIFFVTKKKSKS